MKLKLHHPLWVHFPAVIFLVSIVANIILARPLWHSHVITRYGPTGIPSATISNGEAIAAMILSALLFIGASIAVDEDWARRELHKRFNWLSLLDELIVGFLAALSIAYFNRERERLTNLDLSWTMVAIFCGAGMLLALLFELLRSRSSTIDVKNLELETAADSVHARILAGQCWFYCERQNTRWVTAGIISFSVLMLAAAYDSWGTPVTAFIFLALALIIFLFWGGLAITVTGQRVVVSLGIIAIRLLRIPIADITDASMHEFSPMRDFGGYGVRFNREMKAFFLRGDYGVKIHTSSGKCYLLGSDHPERLEAVIREAMTAGDWKKNDGRVPVRADG